MAAVVSRMLIAMVLMAMVLMKEFWEVEIIVSQFMCTSSLCQVRRYGG
ncbi:MAG TPA: hypothetical protein VFA60_05095 [Terriglobales bacterium]|nr:hypothetical protein [Terriglobales bacterium]